MKRLYFFLSLIFAAVGAAPIFSSTGFLTTRAGGDSPFNLFRLHQLYTALQEGVFPVRWMPDAAFGLGYPFFNFYAALPYYFAALFKAYGFSYVVSLKIVVLLGFLTAAVGMYGWIYAITQRPPAAFLAAVAYTFAPYHLINIYVRGDSLSEFWAMAWYPVIFWTMHRAAQSPKKRPLVAVALAYGALVMTHNISALIFSPFVALYGLILVVQFRPKVKILISLTGAGILGLALAAWFWIPALDEQNTVQLEDQTTGYFFYGNHFRDSNLIQPTLSHDYNAIGVEANPFSMGLVQAIFIGLGLSALSIVLVKQRHVLRDSFLLFGLLFTTFMMTSQTEKLWDALPMLPLVQFPWRLLAIQAFFGAAITGYIASIFPYSLTMDKKWGWGLGWGIVGSLVALAALYRIPLDFMPIRDSDVTATHLQWYESFTGNLGTTIRAEYLPEAVVPRPTTSDVLLQREPQAKFIAGTGSSQPLSRSANQHTWRISVQSEQAQVALPILYWSGWKVYLEGKEIPASALHGLGYTQFSLPAGQHQITIKLTRSPIRFFAEMLSLGATLILLLLISPLLPRFSGERLEKWTAFLAAFLIIAFGLRLVPDSSVTPTLQSADFAQASYFHTGEIPYENSMTLENASYSLQDTTFDYLLAWHITDTPVTYRLDVASPLPLYFLGAPLYPVKIQAKQTAIPTLTPGLYFPRVLLFEPNRPTTQDSPRISPLTVFDVGRGDIYLAPVVARPQTRFTANPTQEMTIGNLKLFAAESRGDKEYLHLTLWWEVLADIPMNYGIDLRLLDVNGTEWARFNALMGGAGMYPTGLWRTGEIIPDTYRLAFPSGLPPANYRLAINIYNAATLESLYLADIHHIPQTYMSEYACPLPSTPIYHDHLRVTEFTFPAQISDSLPIDMAWHAETAPAENYQVAWALQNGEEIVWQTRTPLAPDSDATTWQTDGECGALILARHRLEIPSDIPAGAYTLTMQLLSASGEPLVDLYSPGSVEVIAP